MGRLHPVDFPLRSLDDGERRLAEALIEYTDSSWIVMPTVMIDDDPPVEIDMVLAHPIHGVGIIEVKSYPPRVVNGTWIEPYEKRGTGGPIGQLRRNRYSLRDLLDETCAHLGRHHVESAIAFVNASGFKGDERPTDLEDGHIIWSTDLDVIDSALMRFMQRGRQGTLMFGDGGFADVIRAIRPTVEFESDPAGYTRWGADRLEAYSGAQIRSLERLDMNRRVFVTGGAGTGKSRLALAWARRAAIRGERTLMVCFNEPLGIEFERRLGAIENLDAGAFLPLALELDGIPPLDRPADDASAGVLQTFWNNEVQGHLHVHWPEVTDQYDTIVVDEAQDFSPSWLAMLEALLDPDGSRRMLLVGDAEQELHQRGFQPPRPEDGWTVCELTSNTRNALEIARLLRNRFNGPPAPAALPSATHLRYDRIEGMDQLTASVRAELSELASAGFDSSDVVVATLDHDARDHLRASEGFVPFDEAGPGDIVCETVRRLKGLEFAAVVLVASHWPIDDTLIHVGVSRAVFGLTVIGPAELGERLRLEN
jgi:hypothetical protein